MRFLWLVLILCAVPALASEGLSGRVYDYFDDVITLRADFLQHNSDGSSGSGVFFLSKGQPGNGKMRWEYLDQPFVLIINGNRVIFRDLELGEDAYYFNSDFDFLMRRVSDATFSSNDKYIFMNFIKAGRKILVRFCRNSLVLSGIKITEDSGRGKSRTISFDHVTHNLKLDNNLFH